MSFESAANPQGNRSPGRNDPCWCNSGKKYKKCHMESDLAPRPAAASRIAPGLSRGPASSRPAEPSTSRYCLHPEASAERCSGGITRTPALALNHALEAITEGAFVYAAAPDTAPSAAQPAPARFRRIVAQDCASLSGFCQAHDEQTFSTLEGPLSTPSTEQSFLLAYRAVCREVFCSRPQLRTFRRATLRTIPGELRQGLSMGEVLDAKERYDRLLQRGTPGELHRLTLRLGRVPEVLCSGAFLPEFDFAGHTLPRASRPPLVTFAILPEGNGGLAQLAWEPEFSATAEPLAQSLIALGPLAIGDALVRLALEHIENIYLRPSWFEALPEAVRESFIARSRQASNLAVARASNILRPDEVRFVHWPVEIV